MNPWRKILLGDSMLLFALIYWHNWPIFQLGLPYMSYSASRRRRERHLGICLLIQNHFWHKYQPLQKKMELHASNIIWYNSKYRALPLPLKTCSLRIIDMIGPCITLGTSSPHTSREYKLILGLLWALSPRDCFIFSASRWVGCQPRLLPYMASTPVVVIL